MGRGLAYILGGALQGAGQGIVQKAQMDDQARRDAALSQLRQQEAEQSARLNDQNNANSQGRAADINREQREDEQSFRSTMADKGAQAQEARDRRERDWKKEDDRDAEARALRLEAFRSDQRLREIAAQAGIDAAKVKDVLIDEVTGAVSVVTNGSQSRILPNVIARRQPRAAATNDFSFTTPGKGPIKPTSSYTFDPQTGQLVLDGDE